MVGVLQDTPAAQYRAGSVGVSGITKIRCGGAITKGGRVTSDPNGCAIAVGSGSAWSAGVALDTGASGSIIPMLLQIVGAEYSTLPN